MKDVKKLLQQQSESILPDSSVKEQVKRDLGIYPQREAQAVYAQGGTTSVKTRITWITAVALIVVLAIVLTAILMSMPGSTISPPYVEDKFQNITTADEFYAYGATSVGALLSGQSGSTAVNAAVFANMGKNGGKPTDSQLQAVNGYMLLVEQLLSEESITETVVLLQEGDEMYPQYTYRMDVSFTDLSGNKTSYTMYYNTTALTDTDDDDHDDRHDRKEETEENYAIEGVLTLDSKQYTVEGKYEIENQTDETESEMWFRAYLDAENYIEVKQENESETEGNETETEKEYSYTMYNNGNVVYRTVVDYEMEEGETELSLIVEHDNKKDELSIKERMNKGQRYLEVEGKIDGNDVQFDVEVCNGEKGVFYRYHFNDGTFCEMERGRYGR